MSIIVLGYMGSGKSTVGRLVSQDLEIPHIDLDDYISGRENKTISKIFEDHGEPYFRRLEIQYLKELLSESLNHVISLGGGTPCYGDNMEVVCSKSKNVYYLKTSPAVLAKRLKLGKKVRPLIANLSDDALLDFIKKHLFERSSFYSKANYTIDCDSLSPHQIAEVIVDRYCK